MPASPPRRWLIVFAIGILAVGLAWVAINLRGEGRGGAATPADAGSPSPEISRGVAPTAIPPRPGPPSPFDPHRPPIPPAVDGRPPRSAAEAPLPPKPASAAARTVEAELHFVRTVLADYRAAFGENPVGTNAEIVRALRGKNPRAANFLPANAPQNEQGELLDRWNRPLFFHQISGTKMEIRSAGPDGKMWTADDVQLK